MAPIATHGPVPFWRLYLRMGGVASIALLACLLVMTVISHSVAGTARKFETEGRSALAKVTDKRVEEYRDSDGDRRVRYVLDLAYATREGAQMQIADTVARGVYNATGVGDSVPLLYLPSQPHRIELFAGETRSAARVAQYIGLAFGLAFLVALWMSGHRTVAAVRARRYGAEESVRVIGHVRSAVRVNNQPRYRLEWEDSAGRRGYSMLHRARDLENHPVGSEITIYQGIKRGWWQGDVGPRAG